MTSEQLLEILRGQKLLGEDVLGKLARESLASGKSAEALIHERRLLPDERIAEAKSAALKIPYQRVNVESIDEKLLATIPEETARVYGIVPLEKRDNLFVAGMLNPDDSKAQEALKFIARQTRVNLGVYVISYEDWQKVLRKYSPYKSEVEAAVKALNIKQGAGSQRMVSLEEGAARSEDAPIIRIVADTLREAVQAGASDIHIEPQETYLRVRFRLGGELREAASLPTELAQPVVSRVKVMSNLRIDETRIPQDGRFRTKIFDREIDFRVSTFPTPSGEKVAIRVLDPKTGLKNLADLGLAGKNLETAKAGIEKPFGMIMISGPTGSGKSTTLYALLQLLNKESVNIVSLEDPVEYFVTGVNQSQVRPEIGYDFASGLRQILRQDPDIIMVGEIRDNETAGLAIHAALTGHIVLSTIHTNNAVGVIPRLIDMKVEPFLIPEAVNLMISQRLVPLLCPACRTPEAPSPQIADIIKKALASVPKDVSEKYKAPYQIYHAPGCGECNGRGVTGRVGLFEAFQVTKEIAEIVVTNPTAQKIADEAKRQGMVTMREDGILKSLEGLVAIEEVLRETAE